MPAAPHPDLLILAPKHELRPDFVPWQVAQPSGEFRCATDTTFNEWIEAFVDEGVFFPFDDDGRLPATLPEKLDEFKCIVIDPERESDFASGPDAERLLRFRRQGGYVYVPPRAKLTDQRLRGSLLRVVASAGLTQRHPAMLERLRGIDDDRLVDWWVRSLPEQAAVLIDANAGWAWGDPVAYHFYWPAEAAAEFFADSALMEPVWDCIRAGLDRRRWPRAIGCGKRFAIKYYEKTGDASIRQRLVDESLGIARPESGEARRHWILDGVRINMDLQAPEGVDPHDPPPKVRENAWVWPEVAGSFGDGAGSISRASGDPTFVDQAIRQVLTTHRWNFAPDIGLWYHIGRPSGPDRRTAPWGRGNGWLLYGMRGLLEDLPDAHPARPELVDALRQGLRGLLEWQGPYGLWHNVLDATEETSRQESCSAWMFTNVYARAFRKGWLRDARIPDMCEKAWQGLKTKLWRGLPIAHCSGTPYMVSRQSYLGWAHCKFLGTAPLLAILEIRRMRGEG